MLFDAATLRGLAEGRVDRTFRRWTVVRPRVGSRFTTAVGVVEVTSIRRVTAADLDDQAAQWAGFTSVAALQQWTSAKGSGDLYEVGIRVAGPDPRIALRAEDSLAPAALAGLAATLDRMDRAAEKPWTRQMLAQIRQRPGVVSTELAAELGQERPAYKLRVRRLKTLGLTESLRVGYQLSPRGEAFLLGDDGPSR